MAGYGYGSRSDRMQGSRIHMTPLCLIDLVLVLKSSGKTSPRRTRVLAGSSTV